MSKELEAIKKYEEDPDITVYYRSYDNIPDYAVNNETGEITIFQSGYFGHTEGKTINDLEEIDYIGSEPKESVFKEIDNRIETLIDEYNEAKVHNYRGSNPSTLSEYYLVKGKLEALMDLREELNNDELYW